MELKLQENLFCINKSVFNSCQEVSVSLEINLPDYCTDIAKILKCTAEPELVSKSVSGNRMTVDGNVIINVIYCDSNDHIQAYKTSTPFTKIFESSDELAGGLIKIDFCGESASVRPLSPRKADVNASFKICIDVCEKKEIRMVADAEGGGVETKQSEIIAESYVCGGEKLIILDEIIELGDQRPAVNNILRYDAKARLMDVRLVTNKMIVKGEMSLKILYACGEENSRIEEIEESFPFSQILELDGVDEDCIHSCDTKIQSVNLKERSNDLGEFKIISAEVIVCVFAECRKSVKLPIITDAYSTECELETDEAEEDFMFVGDHINDSTIFKKNLELPVGEISVIDSLWCNCMVSGISCKNNTVVINGTVMTYILGKDDKQKPFFAERPIDFEYRYKAENSDPNMICKISANAKNGGYTLKGGNSIEVRCEVDINGEVVSCLKRKIVASMRLNKDKQIDKSNIFALTLYFAEKGEKVWEIAKKYSTSANAIKRDNDLSDDIIENPCTLLISSK